MIVVNIPRRAEPIIVYTFYSLFFLVPLIWFPFTSELFEFNKIILVYIATSIILVSWTAKTISEKSFKFNRTPLDIPIALFFVSNLLSTLFSIDPHTSFFGYYSRFNGGLISTIAYIVLYYAAVTFLRKEHVYNLLKILLLSSAFVAIYAILQHPNPLFRNSDGSFRGIDAGYWQENPQKRAFSTLGHSNWLAAFLAMVIPFTFFFLTQSKKLIEKFSWAALLVIQFLALTFAYSRGGTLGFVATMLVLILAILFIYRSEIFSKQKIQVLTKQITQSLKRFWRNLRNFLLKIPVFLSDLPSNSRQVDLINKLRSTDGPKIFFFLGLVAASWLVIYLYFGNAFTDRGVNIDALEASTETQLATAGSETGKIRLIVWSGALEIVKAYPILGSGVETFAYAYDQFRPTEHNLTKEWNFIYNKAHNEIINYVATTGILGLLSYLILILVFSFSMLVFILRTDSRAVNLLNVAIFASIVGYHVQNMFSFSVVPISLLFFTLPAIAFVLNGALKPAELKITYLENRTLYAIAKAKPFIIGFLLFYGIFATYLADIYYDRAISSPTNIASYQNLKIASGFRPDEPLYKSNLGLYAMFLALDGSSEQQKEKIDESFEYLNKAAEISPQNLSILRNQFEATYNLALEHPEYMDQAVSVAEKMSALSPNEAEIANTLANVYIVAEKYKEAQKQLEKTVVLRFNYLEAWERLLNIDQELSDKESFNTHFEQFKEHFPHLAKDREYLKDHDLPIN